MYRIRHGRSGGRSFLPDSRSQSFLRRTSSTSLQPSQTRNRSHPPAEAAGNATCQLTTRKIFIHAHGSQGFTRFEMQVAANEESRPEDTDTLPHCRGFPPCRCSACRALAQGPLPPRMRSQSTSDPRWLLVLFASNLQSFTRKLSESYEASFIEEFGILLVWRSNRTAAFLSIIHLQNFREDQPMSKDDENRRIRGVSKSAIFLEIPGHRCSEEENFSSHSRLR